MQLTGFSNLYSRTSARNHGAAVFRTDRAPQAAVRFKGDDEDKQVLEDLLLKMFGKADREGLREVGWLVALASADMNGLDALKPEDAEIALIKSGNERDRRDPVILFWDIEHSQELERSDRFAVLENFATSRGRPLLLAYMQLPESRYPKRVDVKA